MSFILLNLSFYLKTSNKTKILTKKGMEMLTTALFHQDPHHAAIVNKRLVMEAVQGVKALTY